MIPLLRNFSRTLPILGKVLKERDLLIQQNAILKHKLSVTESPNLSAFPDGHFYSPIPSKQDLELFSWAENRSLLGVELSFPTQRRMVKKLATVKNCIRFPDQKSSRFRYFYDNSSFGYADAITLHRMLLIFKPKRIVEVGSGYSTALMLDTVDKVFTHGPTITCIEPYPEILSKALRKQDYKTINLVKQRAQDAPKKLFSSLRANDILFIDSTHVSKLGSDVNTLFFEILPLLRKGVIIHVHDIFKNFEYPKNWSESGFYWNESYLLHAFLMHNNNFKILFWADFMSEQYKKELEQQLPPDFRPQSNLSGGSIWLKKVA